MADEVVNLAARAMCEVEIQLVAEAPVPLGKSPWHNRRVSYIAGGSIKGDLVRGDVLPGGGDWSELGAAADGSAHTLIDVRSVWKTHDGALIYVTYGGRLTIPKDVLPDFRDPAKIDALSPDTYYFRILPVFETADPRYDWLNGVVAVGYGQRTAAGVIYKVYALN